MQELQRLTQEFLDRVLNGRVDPFPGWTSEGNIYWNKSLFEKAEHGAEEVGHVEPERRIFWAPLQLKSLKGRFLSLPPTSPAHVTAMRRKRVYRRVLSTY